MKPKDFVEPIHSQLHHFADASENGYRTVTYIRLLNCKGDVHVAFLLGKARVTPINIVTISRLELTAAVLAARATHSHSPNVQERRLVRVPWRAVGTR